MLTGNLKVGALRAADVLVLPSHQENFGIAVAEALACGVPVLISNKVNIWREVEQDGAGLVDCDDEAGTLRLLQKWYCLDPAQQAAYRVNARQCFAARFEIGRAAEQLLEIVAESRVVSNGHLV
jgi:glycosyltransferase involved in cell wall biosynthesis